MGSPICRTVADATYVLDTIAGYDPYDSKATMDARKYIPQGGYAQFLKLDGLKGKRLGILRKPFFDDMFPQGSSAFKHYFRVLRYAITFFYQLNLYQKVFSILNKI